MSCKPISAFCASRADWCFGVGNMKHRVQELFDVFSCPLKGYIVHVRFVAVLCASYSAPTDDVSVCCQLLQALLMLQLMP